MRVEDCFKLNSKQITEFDEYTKLLLEWNEKINLTAITDVNDIHVKHFIDCLEIAKYVKSGEKLIDIGTGAGFPGIPLKINNENLNVTLVDSLNKRVMFLNDVIEKLNLNGIEAIHARAEDMGKDKNYREKYDVAVSRAVASLNVLVEYLLPLVKVGGRCICMKGPNAQEEIENAQNAIKILGGKIDKIENLELPENGGTRTIIIIKKIKNTDKKYPRKAGEPSKKPL